MTDRVSYLLAQAEPAELAELVDLQRRRNESRTEAIKLREKGGKLSRQGQALDQDLQDAATKRRAALVAEALEEAPPAAPPPPPPAGPSPSEMKAAAEILLARASEATERAAALHGELRTREVDLIVTWAQRLGAVYLDKARELAVIHATILAAQEILQSAGITRTLVGPEWTSLHVPNSDQLTALRSVGVIQGSNFQRLPVVGGGDAAVRAAASQAAVIAKAELRELLGGEWPLDRN